MGWGGGGGGVAWQCYIGDIQKCTMLFINIHRHQGGRGKRVIEREHAWQCHYLGDISK